MSKDFPLVSVIVITYNSSDTITETLHSVKEQDYANIELIVSDDSSKDSTVNIVKEWLKNNADRFVRTNLVESPVNTGVAPNINRGIRKGAGKWIKVLSGDDRLLPYSIEEYVKYVQQNPSCNICFGKLHFFGNDFHYVDEQKAVYEHTFYPYIKADYNIQWRRIQETLFVPGPGLFYKKELWSKVGGFDEHFPFAEEYPFTYNVLECGERIYFLDKEVYAYQIREGSLCRDKLGMNKRVFSSQFSYIKKKHIFKLLKHGYFFLAIHLLIRYFRVSLLYNNVPIFIYKTSFLLYIFSPYTIIHKIFPGRERQN